uniref:Uncharacterized protein n=1 Tax=Lepeophtheirus salmonis TaxID=72036 RepID=A0A0K2VFP9_LEPSM
MCVRVVVSQRLHTYRRNDFISRIVQKPRLHCQRDYALSQ